MKKFLIIALTALPLSACSESFETECDEQNGTLSQISSEESTCTLPDGKVISSKTGF